MYYLKKLVVKELVFFNFEKEVIYIFMKIIMYFLPDRKSNNKIYVYFLANLMINIFNNVETKNIFRKSLVFKEF